VKKGTAKSSLSDIQIGDRVTVKYSEADGKSFARSIEIKTAKAEKTGPGGTNIKRR
jgi:hypothetical protein